LPAAITSLEKTLTNVNKLVLSVNSGYGDNTQFSRDLERLLQQLNDMVRSIRAVADVLARHPEALIKGRPGGLE
jgi:paraquat-inducible protein B